GERLAAFLHHAGDVAGELLDVARAGLCGCVGGFCRGSHGNASIRGSGVGPGTAFLTRRWTLPVTAARRIMAFDGDCACPPTRSCAMRERLQPLTLLSSY